MKYFDDEIKHIDKHYVLDLIDDPIYIGEREILNSLLLSNENIEEFIKELDTKEGFYFISITDDYLHLYIDQDGYTSSDHYYLMDIEKTKLFIQLMTDNILNRAINELLYYIEHEGHFYNYEHLHDIILENLHLFKEAIDRDLEISKNKIFDFIKNISTRNPNRREYFNRIIRLFKIVFIKEEDKLKLELLYGGI